MPITFQEVLAYNGVQYTEWMALGYERREKLTVQAVKEITRRRNQK